MKSVTIEELKERLDEVIAEVETGETVGIVRHGVTVAKVESVPQPHRGVPYPFRNLHITPIGKDLGDEAVRMLIEDREYERSNKKYGL